MTGAADSITGTDAINARLSNARATCIADQLFAADLEKQLRMFAEDTDVSANVTDNVTDSAANVTDNVTEIQRKILEILEQIPDISQSIFIARMRVSQSSQYTRNTPVTALWRGQIH